MNRAPLPPSCTPALRDLARVIETLKGVVK